MGKRFDAASLKYIAYNIFDKSRLKLTKKTVSKEKYPNYYKSIKQPVSFSLNTSTAFKIMLFADAHDILYKSRCLCKKINTDIHLL